MHSILTLKVKESSQYFDFNANAYFSSKATLLPILNNNNVSLQ